MALQTLNWFKIMFKSLKIWPKLSNLPIIAHILAKFNQNSAEILAKWTDVVVIISSKVSNKYTIKKFIAMVYIRLCESLGSLG